MKPQVPASTGSVDASARTAGGIDGYPRPRAGRAADAAKAVAVGALWFFASLIVIRGATLIVLVVVLRSRGHAPSLEDMRLLGPTALASLTVGVVAALRHLPPGTLGWLDNRRDQRRPPPMVAPVAVLAAIVLLPWGVMHVWHRAVFLSKFDYHGVSGAYEFLSAGNAACNWLQDHPWGEPAASPLPSRVWNRSNLRFAWPPYGKPSINSNSTEQLYAEYVRDLRRATPGPLTAQERLKVQVAYPAWYRLCPASQWIRRPVFDSGD